MIHNNTRFGVQRNDVAPTTFRCAAQCKRLRHTDLVCIQLVSGSSGRKTWGYASAFHDFLSPKSYIQTDDGSVRPERITSHLSTADTKPPTICRTGILGIRIYHIRRLNLL